MIRDPMPTLLGADAPRVLTVPMLAAALSDGRSLPARGTLFNWLRAQRESGVLRPVTRGLYLNALALPRPQAAEAAAYVRTGAVVSLQTVLGDCAVTNNYSDIVTCVVPIRDGVAPSSRPVKPAAVGNGAPLPPHPGPLHEPAVGRAGSPLPAAGYPPAPEPRRRARSDAPYPPARPRAPRRVRGRRTTDCVAPSPSGRGPG